MAMNLATIDKKIRESAPLKYLTIGGIALAVITFFYILFLIVQLLLGLVRFVWIKANSGYSANASTTPATGYIGDPRSVGSPLIPYVPDWEEVKNGRLRPNRYQVPATTSVDILF